MFPRRLFQIVVLPPLRARHVLALAICLTLGAAANLYRAAWHHAGDWGVFRASWP